jgi:hypothetical protein
VTGFTGSGKTDTVLNILHQLWNESHVPFLVIEPAKREYRGLLAVNDWEKKNELQIYTLGDSRHAPFGLNPFALLEGISVETHVGRLLSCFEAALPQLPWLPSVLQEAIEEIYADYGWRTSYVGPDETTGALFPTMVDLYHKIDQVVAERDYGEEVRRNVLGATKGRLKTLLMGSVGNMFRQQPTTSLNCVFTHPTILELDSLNQHDKSLIMMFILMFLREHRTTRDRSDSLKHVTVVEEAHNVVGREDHRSDAELESDAKASAVEVFCNMLAEVRAYGEGIFIVDQSPEKVSRDVLRNTNIQIAHQVRDAKDRATLADTMLMTDEQENFLNKIKPGNAALFHSDLQQTSFIQVPAYSRCNDDERPRGIGYGVVDSKLVRDHMANRVVISPQEKPFRECATCNSFNDDGCKYRFATHELMRNPLLKDRMIAWDDKTYGECTVTATTAADELTSIVFDALSFKNMEETLLSIPERDEVWCFLLHAYQFWIRNPTRIDEVNRDIHLAHWLAERVKSAQQAALTERQ